MWLTYCSRFHCDPSKVAWVVVNWSRVHVRPRHIADISHVRMLTHQWKIAQLNLLYTLTWCPSFSQIRPESTKIRPFEVLDTQKFPRSGRIVLFVRNGRIVVQPKALTHLDRMQHVSWRSERIWPLRKRQEGQKKDWRSVKERPENSSGNGLTL